MLIKIKELKEQTVNRFQFTMLYKRNFTSGVMVFLCNFSYYKWSYSLGVFFLRVQTGVKRSSPRQENNLNHKIELRNSLQTDCGKVVLKYSFME